jgi:hypothetical protein
VQTKVSDISWINMTLNKKSQMQIVLDLYSKQTSVKIIINDLQSQFGIQAISKATVYRWLKKIEINKSIEDNDYEWFLLNEYGIDWKDSKKLEELLDKYEGQERSGRFAKWVWRLSYKFSDHDSGYLFTMAEEITKKEREAHLLLVTK